MSIVKLHYTNRKIFKAIEAKLNAQNAELIDRGRVIEELKTTLSLFIDKYNKLKDDFEKEKQMGINLALSFSTPKAITVRKHLPQQLAIAKTPGVILRGLDTKKFLIINLEKERDDLKSQLSHMKKNNEEVYQLLGKVKTDLDEYKAQIGQLKNTIEALQLELMKEKNDNSDLIREISQLKTGNENEMGTLRKANDEAMKEIEELNRKNETMKTMYEDREKEIKDKHRKIIEQMIKEKTAVVKQKEEIEKERNEYKGKIIEIEMELSCERKLNEELNKLIKEQSGRIDYYKKETSNYNNSLKENDTLMKQLELLQERLNQLSSQALSQKKLSRASLVISNAQILINYNQTPQLNKLKTINNNSNSNSTQIETQLKTITVLQSEKEALTKKVKELNDSLTKTNSKHKESTKLLTNNLLLIKETLMATYQSNNLAMISIHKKLDDTVIDFTNRIASMKKQLKVYATKPKDTSNPKDIIAYKEKEKSMKDVISKLEQEKEKLTLKVCNYESHMKDLSGKLAVFDFNASDSNTKAQNIKKENETLMKSNKTMEKTIKELEQKVEMYIIENNGKSKIIEERNDEIKKIKAKFQQQA